MLARAFVILLSIASSLAAPISVPFVSGVDQSPTKRENYGKCTSAVEPSVRQTSHWCKFGRVGSWPEYPNTAAKKNLKFSRLTNYAGPVGHLLACNVTAYGSDTHAIVAVSTKYLKTYEGGWAKKKGSCMACTCQMILGGDDFVNGGLQRKVVLRFKGLAFMGRVGDRLGEGCDDCIDVFRSRPWSYSPLHNNPRAEQENHKSGLRAFSHLSGPLNPDNVGVWTALWQFVPCSWTHQRCAAFMNSHGYKTYTPQWTPGL